MTDAGCVRTKNEDRIFLNEDLGIFIISDGMGGHTHGEIAAELATSTMQHYLESSQDRLDITWPFGYNFELSVDANRLATAIQLANRQVWKQAEKAPEYSGMGTTIAAAIVNGSKLTVGNVGDSRVYIWHGGSLLQVTIDDPKSYTKPWVSPPKLHKLESGWEIAEWFCAVEEDKAYDEVVRKPAGVAPKK